MKKTLTYTSLILLLAGPLFPALLTQEFGVVSPTGIPLYHFDCAMDSMSHTNPRFVNIRFIETRHGVLLIREYSRGGVSQLNQKGTQGESSTGTTTNLQTSGGSLKTSLE